MNKIELDNTALTIADLAKLAKTGPVILTHLGKPLAAVKDLSGSDWESVSLANNPQFMAIIEESRRSFRQHGGISIDEIRREFALKPRRGTGKKPNNRKKRTPPSASTRD